MIKAGQVQPSNQWLGTKAEYLFVANSYTLLYGLNSLVILTLSTICCRGSVTAQCIDFNELQIKQWKDHCIASIHGWMKKEWQWNSTGLNSEQTKLKHFRSRFLLFSIRGNPGPLEVQTACRQQLPQIQTLFWSRTLCWICYLQHDKDISGHTYWSSDV